MSHSKNSLILRITKRYKKSKTIFTSVPVLAFFQLFCIKIAKICEIDIQNVSSTERKEQMFWPKWKIKKRQLVVLTKLTCN